MRNNCLYGLFFFVLTIQSKSQSAPAVYGTNSFLFKSPFAVNESVVSFFLRGNLNAKKVIVTGNFTNWSTTSISMTRTDSGWIAPVKLGAGKHYYKFIIDGVWDIDNDNKNFETDPNGYINSVYYKTNTLFKLPSYSGAKAVFLCGSFNNWKENELKMQKTAKGWELPLYLSEGTFQYRFIVDGKGYTDPLNSRKTRDLQNRLCSFITVGQEKITVAKGMQLAAQYETDAVALTAEMNYTAALQRYRQAEEIYHSIKLPDSAGSVLLKSAAVYRLQADFPSQLQAIQKAIKLFEQTGTPEKLAAGYRALGSHHINLGKWSLAFEGYEKAMHLYEQVGNKMMVALTLHQMGHSCGFYDKEKSLVYLNRSLKLSEQIGYEVGIAENHWLLGFHYTGDLKDTLTALKYYAKADELYKKNNSKGGMAEIRLVLAKLYIESSDSIVKKMGINPRDRLDEAIKAEKKGLQLYSDLRSAARIQVVNMFLSETFEKAGHYDSALVYYRRWVDAQYKFYNNEKERELARIQESFRFYKLEDSLNLQRLLMEGRLQKQSLLAAQQQQQLALSNKEKELQRLAFLKSQADLQNEQLSRQQKEKQLSLSEKEKELQSARVKTLTQEKAIAQLNQQRQWIYIGSIFLLLAFASVYFIYRWRIRSIKLETQLIKEQSEKQNKEAEFQHKLADISLSALRSQMNPHFIFNCLNSIKLYTVQNDTAAAASYLSRFSKLIRLVLDNSRSERITLRSELAALELYIQMEAMRFKEKLRYTISVDDNVETDYIELPPLLLQPYVENAIWHGLMHKEEGGQIDIKVEMKNEGSLLEVNIVDDGIGRAKAGELKNKNHHNHASYGMKATSERIALINQTYKTGANVVIHDLVDHEGDPAGTQVTIQIPV